MVKTIKSLETHSSPWKLVGFSKLTLHYLYICTNALALLKDLPS